MRLGVALAPLLLLLGGWEGLRAADPDVDEGNRVFSEGRFDEALGHYRSAESRGNDPRLHFDMGAALYKLGEKATDEGEKAKLFAQAEEQFRRAAETDDLRLKSSAYYNLGNSMYQRKQWENAISAYKRALVADPHNEAARNNLEMALRQREKQQKQAQQPNRDQGGQKGQKPGQDQKQQGQGQDREPGDREDQKQQDRKGQGQEGQDRQQDRQDSQKGQGPGKDRQPVPDRPPPGQQEEARGDESMGDTSADQERKLDELERRSRDLRKRLLRQGSSNRDPMRLPSRKDW